MKCRVWYSAKTPEKQGGYIEASGQISAEFPDWTWPLNSAQMTQLEQLVIDAVEEVYPDAVVFLNTVIPLAD